MSEADAKNWRKRLNQMRTISALRAESADGQAAERAKPEALQAAIHNPDHSEAGRAAARSALGATAEPWRLSAPSFLNANDLKRGEALFFGWGARLRALLLLVAVASAAALITSFFIARPLAEPSFAIFAAATIFWVLASLFRLKPARLVLARASEDRLFTPSFRAFVGTELAGFGHIWRLAGPEAQERIGHKVASAAGYRALAHALRHLIGLNWESATGAACSTVPVGATPAWRGLTQNLLFDSADVVVVDLSGAQDAWPLDAARGEPACVFVSLWGQGEAANVALRQAHISADCHLYAPDGHLLNRSRFREAMIAAMRAKHQAAG